MCSKGFVLYSTLFFVLICENESVWCLQINHLLVPEEASHEAPLDCRYSLDPNETLYDVKWYKDGAEFFRCRSDGNTIQFTADGIKLQNSSESAKIGSCPVTLIELCENTTGEYACEVSIEFTFNAETKRSRLNFVNSTLIQNNQLKFIKDAQTIESNEKQNGLMMNEANVLLLQPCLLTLLIVIIFTVNKMIKN